MEIKLKERHMKKVKKGYTPMELNSFTSKKEEDIVKAYYNGDKVSDIVKEFNISYGFLYSVIDNNKVGKRQRSKRVRERVSHILSDKRKLNGLINDYGNMTNSSIYKKYNIHKNGLYYILDLYDVPRLQGTKEEILVEDVKL